MMVCVSQETQDELAAASRAYRQQEKRSEAVRARLHAAIIAEKREGTSVRNITDRSPYQRGRVTTILEDAGLTEKRKPRRAPVSPNGS
jgi:hypothetical protein